MKASQLVIVPSPGVGHLISTVEFAKLLINHDPSLSITVFIIKPHSHSYIDSFLSSPDFPNSLHFIHLPNPHTNHSNFIQNHIPQVRQAVSDLIHQSDSTKLTGFIVDMFCTAMIDVADEFNIPAMVFFTSDAASLGFFLHLQSLQNPEILQITAPEFKDSGTEFAIPSFQNPVPASVFPSMVLRKERRQEFFNYIKGLNRAKVFIVNTFEEIESHPIRTLNNSGITVYPVGPLFNPNGNNHEDESTSDVIQWLDHQPPSSVIFLCFGSKGCFPAHQVTEIARAIENSGHRFVWSLRKPSLNSPRDSPTDYPDLSEVLPEGFLERTAEIGRVIGWAPQTQILAHPAIGGFVSHCGWNSILESIYYGVPIATWPLYAEQQLNALQLVRDLNLAEEITLDFNLFFALEDESIIVSAEKIEKGIKELMKEESEVRKKVKEVSDISRKALLEGGSSYSALRRFIDDINNIV